MDAESLMSPWRCIYSDSNFNRSFWMITALHRNASLSFLCKLCKLTQWPSTDKYPTQLRVPLSLFSWRCLCGNSQEQYLCFCKMEKPHTLAFMSGVYRNQVCPEVKNKLVLECLLSCHHRWSYSLSLTDSIYTPLRGGGTICSWVYWLWPVSHHTFAGRKEAQELSGTWPFYALLHTLQEPRAQLSGKRVSDVHKQSPMVW